MAWVKLDDSMPHHPKVVAAGPVAFALDVAAICYSNRYATDGFIASSVLRTCLPGVRNVQKVAQKLVECGRWVETDGGWLIHDIDEYQPTAEEQKNISRVRAEAGRKGGKASGQTRANRKQVASKPEAKPKQVASNPGNPDPTRPDPTISDLLPSVVDHGSDRPRNEVWDALVDVFGEPTTDTNRTLRGKIVASLRRANASYDDVILRCKAWPLHFPNATLTETALEKHWDRLGTVPARATKQQVRQLEAEMARRNMRARLAQ